MALDFDIKFIDEGGNHIEGSCEQVGKEGLSLGNAFQHNIARSTKNAGRRATGRNKHKPVKIWKEIDKASVKLADAFYRGARLDSCTIRFWRPENDGTENNHLTCHLERVQILSHTVQQLHNQFDDGKDMGVALFEVLDLAYETIAYTYNDDGTEATIDWASKRA